MSVTKKLLTILHESDIFDHFCHPHPTPAYVANSLMSPTSHCHQHHNITSITLYHLFSCPILTLSYWANLCSSAQSTKSMRSVALNKLLSFILVGISFLNIEKTFILTNSAPSFRVLSTKEKIESGHKLVKIKLLSMFKLTELVWSSNTCFVDQPSNLREYFQNHLKNEINAKFQEIILTFISFPVSVKRYFTVQTSLNNSPSTTISFLIAPDFKPYFWRWSNSINTWCCESSLVQFSTMFGAFHWNYFDG